MVNGKNRVTPSHVNVTDNNTFVEGHRQRGQRSNADDDGPAQPPLQIALGIVDNDNDDHEHIAATTARTATFSHLVTTTTTTTTYAPITLPPLPPPPSPSTYDPKAYPLLRAALPPSLRNIELVLPGGIHATLRDSNNATTSEMKEEEEVASSGSGWAMLKGGQASSNGGSGRSASVGLAEALERYSQTAKKRAKEDDDDDEMMEGVEFHSLDAGDDSAPPRKKARGPPSSPAAAGQPLSPLPSPHGSPPPPDMFPSHQTHVSPPPPPPPTTTAQPGAPPPFQPDLGLNALLTLPTLLSHFSALPPSLQSHLLLTLLRYSPLPVLRSVHSVLTPTLARDFLMLLPPELVQNILGWLEWPTLVRMTRVSRGWKSIVDGDGVLWRGVMKRERVWWGGEMEEGWERWLRGRRRRREGATAIHNSEGRFQELDQDADESDIQPSGPSGAYPSPRNSTVVLPGTASASRHVPTPVTPSHPSSYSTAQATPQEQEPAMTSSNPPIDPPHPYKILFKSRHLTRSQWLTNLTPRHINFQAHGHSVVTCLIFADVAAPPPSSPSGTSQKRSSTSRKRIISASDDHSIHVYSPSTGALEMRLEGHEGGVWALAAMGGLLVSGSTDRTVRVWDLGDGEPRSQSGVESDSEEGVTPSRKGKCLHVFGGHTSTVRCLAIVKPEMVDVGGEFGGDGPQRKEKWPKRPLIVTGSRDHSLRVWILPRKGEQEFKCTSSGNGREDGGDGDVCDAEENPYHLLHLEGHDHAVRALAARGRTLVSGSYDCTVRVWDIATGKCRFVLTGHGQKVYSVVLDPIRNITASGSMDGTVRVWSTLNGTCLHVLNGHTSLVGLLGLSPSHLVSAAADSTLRIWDVERGECKAVLAAHTGAITCFQHDEFKVVSGSDGTLKVWDLRAATAAAEEAATAGAGVAVPPPPVGGLAVGGAGGIGIGAAGAVGGAVAGVGGAAAAGAAGVAAAAAGGAGGGTTVPVRDLLTGITGVWQVAFEGRWCVAASNRNDQTVLDVWDFGRKDGDVDVGPGLFAGEGGEGQLEDEYGDEEDGVYEEGWIGEPPGGMYEDDEGSEGGDDDSDMQPRTHRQHRHDDDSDDDDADTFGGGGLGGGSGPSHGKGKGKGGGGPSRKPSSTLRYPDEDAVMQHEDQDVVIIEDDDDGMSFGTAATGRSVSPLVIGTSNSGSKASGSRRKATASSSKHRRQQAQPIVIEDGDEDQDEAMDIVATASVPGASNSAFFVQQQQSSRGSSSMQTDSAQGRSDSEGPPKRATRASGRKETTGTGTGPGTSTGNGRRRKWL
ncbi:SCF ubiquitin ligase complex subunit cdc4 [Marasmius crinis-equi]|uniref:SCF ubiquitin ligase complex subunit cdc4 n=1 Tax=Marasmius crinis-equi TaxID=585013 RepID=A0ABR3F908_9AGAR